MGDKNCWRQNLPLFSKNVQLDSKEIVWIHDICCLQIYNQDQNQKDWSQNLKCTCYNTNSVIDYGSFSTFNVTNAAWRQNLGKFLVNWYLNNKNSLPFTSILTSLFKPWSFFHKKKRKKNTLLMPDVFMCFIKSLKSKIS